MKHTEDNSPCWWWLASLFMGVVLVAILAACTAEELPAVPQEADLPATINLDIRIDSPRHTQTRAVDENSIADLHVLIYNKLGELIGQKYEKYENNNGNKLTVNTRSAKQCTIYVIANTGNEVLFRGREAATEEGLRSMITPQLAAWNSITEAPHLLMAGSKENVDILPGNNVLTGQSLTISSVAAKVKLNIKVAENSGITITDYRIYGLPKQSFYVPNPVLNTDAGTGNDAITPTDASLWCNSGKIVVNGTAATKEFYMYENRRGINRSIEKAKDKCQENAPDSATYVVVNGKTGYYNSTWRVYLGKNDTSNFNLERNVNYNYTVTLSRNAADLRVDIEDIYPSTDEAQTSNCYILCPGHALTIPVLRANESPIQIGTSPMVNGKCIQLQEDTPWTAEVVWQSSPGLVGVSDAIDKGSAGRFKVTTTDQTTQGNAVVAIRSGENILWSWHIWIVNETEKAKISAEADNQRYWMDRNLGALVCTPGDNNSLGLLYQWGRKDPFPGSASSSTNIEPILYTADNNTFTSNAKSVIAEDSNISSITYAIRHPQSSIHINNSMQWLSIPDQTLWQSASIVKTVYDPCPSGWKVATNEMNIISAIWSSEHSGRTIIISEGIDYWFPANGCRYNGNIWCVPNEGYYWFASSGTTNNPAFFHFHASGYQLYLNEQYPARAAAVRCCRE